jgi:hypothetical protein
MDGGPRDGVEGLCAERLAGLIARVLTLDPSQRPSAAELLPPPKFDLPRVGDRVVVRPDLFGRLKRAVLAGGGGAVAVTQRLKNRRKVWGMGGVGKTTLAKMLLADEDVRARFRDGVAWVVLGNEDPNLSARQEDVYFQLMKQRPNPPFKDERQGAAVLREALAHKACLVVVDDVWKQSHAQAFDVCGPEGMLLVTTRFDNVVSTPPEACIKVDVLQPPDGDEALKMLRSHAGEEGDEDEDGGVAERKGQAAGEPDDDGQELGVMKAVLRRCGGVPLAIALAGSLRRSRRLTWGKVLEAMEQQGGRLLKRRGPSEDEEYPDKGLWEALGASVEHLKADDRQHYECLLWYGAFMEDTWVPLEIVRRVWGMDELDSQDVLESLAGRSLIELDGGGQWRSQAHDLLRDFLQAEAREAVGEGGVRQMHGAIVRQGMQACERARFNGTCLKLHPYFGSEGVAWHMDRSGEGTVSPSSR